MALGGGGAAVRGDAVAVLLGGADGVPARERHQMHGRGEQGPCRHNAVMTFHTTTSASELNLEGLCTDVTVGAYVHDRSFVFRSLLLSH